MKTKIVKIGNSRGVRIPKSFLEESGLTEEAEIEIENGKIVIKPVTKARSTWDSAFKKMDNNNDDLLMDAEALSEQSGWDKKEWEW